MVDCRPPSPPTPLPEGEGSEPPPTPLPEAEGSESPVCSAGRLSWARGARRSIGLLLVLLGLAAPSYALFGDEEARKAIVDLRDQVAQLEKAQTARIDELSQRIDRIDNTLQAIQRGQV